MNRINYLCSLIQNCETVIDVGSDHAYLAINLLKNEQVKKVINIEINEGPLKQGIKNLQRFNLLKYTENILNNGLNNFNFKFVDQKFDYCVISGLGSTTIMTILGNNQLEIDKFVLQTNSDDYKLRKYLINNNYFIEKDEIIFDNDKFYHCFLVLKNNFLSLKINWTTEELFFGKFDNKEIKLKYLLSLKKFLEKNITDKFKNPQILLKQELLVERLKKYDFKK